MTIQAKWNNKIFEISNNKILAISNFTISTKLKTEEKKSKSGSKKVTIKGLQPEELQVNFASGFSAGADPRQENEDFKKLTGQIDTFYLGNKKLGRGNFMLEETAMSDTLLSNTGRIYHAEHSLKFRQYVASSKKTKAKKYDATEAEIAEAKSALGIGPGPQDKKNKK